MIAGAWGIVPRAMKKPIQTRDWLVAALSGILVGAASAALVMPGGVQEMFRRMGNPEGGEASDWGELAFYLAIVAVPVGLVTTVAALFVHRALRKP